VAGFFVPNDNSAPVNEVKQDDYSQLNPNLYSTMSTCAWSRQTAKRLRSGIATHS
jgi:hypothetical protein